MLMRYIEFSTVFFFFSTKKTTTTMTKEVTEVATQRVNDGRAQAYELLFMCYKLITIFFSMTHSTCARNVMEFSRLFLQSIFSFSRCKTSMCIRRLLMSAGVTPPTRLA